MANKTWKFPNFFYCCIPKDLEDFVCKNKKVKVRRIGEDLKASKIICDLLNYLFVYSRWSRCVLINTDICFEKGTEKFKFNKYTTSNQALFIF